MIRQPRGNMLLVAVGGSGRKSLSKMAASICKYQVFQVEITKQYGKQEFREGEIKHTSFTFIYMNLFWKFKQGHFESKVEIKCLIKLPLAL